MRWSRESRVKRRESRVRNRESVRLARFSIGVTNATPYDLY